MKFLSPLINLHKPLVFLMKIIRTIPLEIILIILAFALSYPIFKPGFMLYMDHPVHLAEAIYLNEVLLPKYNWINGFSQDDFAGFPLQLYFYQTGFWLMILINRIFHLPLVICYKIVIVFSLIFPSLSLYWLLKKVIPSWAAFLSSALFLLRADVLWEIFKGTFHSFIALGFIFLFWLMLIKFIEKPSLIYIPFLIILWVLAILSHIYNSLAIPVILIMTFILEKSKLPKFRLIILFTAIILSVFLLSGFYLFPIIETGKWLPQAEQGMPEEQSVFKSLFFASYGFPPNMFTNLKKDMIVFHPKMIIKDIKELVAKQGHLLAIFFASFLGVLATIFGHQWRKESINFRFSALAFAVFFVFMSSFYWISSKAILSLPVIGFIQGFFSRRFLIFVHSGWHILAGFGFAFIGEKIFYLLFKNRKFVSILILGIFSAIYAAIFIFGYQNPTLKPGMQAVSSEIPEYENLKSLWRKIKLCIDKDNGRVFYQSTFGNASGILGSSHILALSTRMTDIPSIGGWCKIFLYPINNLTRTNSKRIFGIEINHLSIDSLVNNLKAFNCPWLVTCDARPELHHSKIQFYDKNKTLDGMVRNSNKFRLILEEGIFKLYQLKNYQPSFVDFSFPDTEYKILEFSPHKIYLKAKNNLIGNRLMLKVAYHPWWSVSANNIPLKIYQTERYLMEISLPLLGDVDIVFSYRLYRWQYLALSLLGLIFSIVFTLISRKLIKLK